ncbi:TIGR00251 family protein [Teladorsagia circumcincta]|uniref:TIGR00251 family protein n=1 Tax=Teladorsagia circumcincta TaxID=45464 RepID=A0A2G9UHN9_TELCI|nr:TIGR00251 family protein [Teladorsagia circumcincta]
MSKQSGAVSVDKNGNILLRILAKPGAKMSAVTDVGDDEVGIAIAAPPREGEANEELVDYMRGLLGLKKSELVLDKGGKSRSKTLLITSSRISLEEVVAKLKAAAER